MKEESGMGRNTVELSANRVYEQEVLVEMPASTAWPVVLAFGVTLIFAGLVTAASVTALGALFAVSGCVGWVRQVLPHERHEVLRAIKETALVRTERPQVARVDWITEDLHRARLPIEVYPISAGALAGMGGGVAMAFLAAAYGIISGRGIWYPINLLAAGFYPGRSTTAEIAAFHWDSLLIALIVHLVCSLLVGLLYGAALPMFPRRPVLFGGIVAPVLWSGLLHSVLDAINPVLNGRIDWPWFFVSQIGYGVVAGAIVSRRERVRTWQYLPLAIRAGVEAAGAIDGKDKDGENPHS
jgi:hypothetical protein